jgi:hypothetical protein
MILRVPLDLDQYKFAKKQLMKFASELFSNCTECTHILEDAQSASCDVATRFSGLIQIYIKEILLKDS